MFTTNVSSLPISTRRTRFQRRLRSLLQALAGSAVFAGTAAFAQTAAVVTTGAPVARPVDAALTTAVVTSISVATTTGAAGEGSVVTTGSGTATAGSTPGAATPIRAETAWFLASGQRGATGPESFVVPVSGAARIAEVRQYLAERAEGRESRPLIPTVVLRVGSDGRNRNHAAPGAPLWPWHVAEVVSFARYTWPEVEPAVFIAARDSSPSEIESLIRGSPLSLPTNTVYLRGFPIVMELGSEFPGHGRPATLANLSDRGLVGTGGDAKITGIVIEGDAPRNVVVRVLGPTLARFGVTNALLNPRFEVYRGSEKIAENDDWAAGNLNRSYLAVVPPPSPMHLIPNDPREPALELSLAPGAYTIVVTGVGGTSGVVLTEVHSL